MTAITFTSVSSGSAGISSIFSIKSSSSTFSNKYSSLITNSPVSGSTNGSPSSPFVNISLFLIASITISFKYTDFPSRLSPYSPLYCGVFGSYA
jgi:hypothetical protein